MTTQNEKSPAPELTSEAVNQRPRTEAAFTEVVPTAEDILDARATGGNGTSSKVRISWSRNNEDFTCDELDELLDGHDDLTVGDVVFYGTVVPIQTSDQCDAGDMIDMIGNRAYEQAGEYADGYPYIEANAKAELDSLLAGWIEKHAKPTFYLVESTRECVITAADMEGREQ